LTRTFTRDWLGRVTSETHPEWFNLANNQLRPTSYTYDANGQVLTRTDPRNIVATYTYDWAGRPLTTSYSDTTPSVTRTYDAPGYKGLLTSVSVSNATTSASFTYNNADMVASETRTIAGLTKTTSYTYDLDDRLLTITYPSGRQVQRTYQSGNGRASGRLSTLQDATTQTTLISNVLDNAAGQTTNRDLGNGVAGIAGFQHAVSVGQPDGRAKRNAADELQLRLRRFGREQQRPDSKPGRMRSIRCIRSPTLTIN
jgi:YD repeat-containing protein